MSEEKNELVVYKEEDSLEKQIDQEAKNLSMEIAKAKDKNTLDLLYDEFKLTDTKKNIFRINKLNNLLDKITDEAVDRFENRPGEMSNKEVIDYMNAVQTQISKAKDTVNDIKNVDIVQVNKVSNTLNVNFPNEETTLSRESKEKIIDFIKNFLKSDNNGDKIVKDDVIDIDTMEDIHEK